MTRKKVELTYITNDSKRKATLKKRKHGLMKKVDELSTLCGIEACAIVYSPNDPQPEIWPSAFGFQRVLAKFKNMPELEQSKKMLNQEGFLKQRILKAQELLKKQKNENRKKEMTQLMFQYLNVGNNNILGNMNMIDLNDLSWLIDQNLKEINHKMNRISLARAEAEPQIATDNGGAMNNGEINVDDMNHDQGAMQRQHWSMDLINGGGDETLPFGDVNLQNGFWPNPVLP